MAHMNRKPTRSVFVGNIGPEVTEQMLHDIFSPIGSLKSVRVVLERDTGVSKGYGFCAYYDLANAESAVRNLSGRDLNGRPMRLGFAEDYAFRNSDQQGSQGTGGAAAQGVVQQPPFQQQQLPTHPQVMIPEPAAQYQAQAPAAPNVASQDQISSTLSKMSRADLFNILAQMKLLIEQNSGQARHILVQNPQLTKALFQAQILLGMVQGPVQAQPGPGGPPAQDPAAHQPQQPPPYHGQASPAAHPAPLSLSAHPPTAPPTVFANGGPGAAANGFGAPSQGAFPAGAVAGQQQPYQQGLQHSVVQAQFPAALQQQQQQQAQASGPLQYAAAASLPPMQQAQQQVQQQQQQHSEQLGQQQPAQPAMGADQQRALLQQVMNLTPQQIDLLPPQQKAQVIALQQQMSQFR